jgi:ABC-type branched-subunit amino acid transport system substrate-binding protein
VQTGAPASFRGAADAVVTADVDAVFIAGLEEPCACAAASIRSRSRAVFLGTDAMKPTRSLVTNSPVEGPYLTSASVDASETAPAFHSRFQARFGSHLSIYTVEAYDAVRLTATAIRTAIGHGPDRVSAAIRRLGTYTGIGGDIRFDDDGERIAPKLGIYLWDGARMRFLSSYIPTAG